MQSDEGPSSAQRQPDRMDTKSSISSGLLDREIAMVLLFTEKHS